MGGIFPGSVKVHGPNMLNQFPHTDAEVGIPVSDFTMTIEADSRVYGPNYLHPYRHTADGLPTGRSLEQKAAVAIAARRAVSSIFVAENYRLLHDAQ